MHNLFLFFLFLQFKFKKMLIFDRRAPCKCKRQTEFNSRRFSITCADIEIFQK